ncbi:hypothetical protein GCM10028805_16240 [Spirosoma harenae]
MKAQKNDEQQPATEVVKVELKTCFVVMPIADPLSLGYDGGHFQRVYDYIIKPACLNAGFEPKRADDSKSAHLIMVDILQRILNADMVVCDLSARNPNVMYELGLRQAFDKPVTLIRDDVTTEPFDIQGIRYIEYDKELRIDLVEKAKASLKEAIEETYQNRDKDIFSLVHILGRSAAKIDESKVDPNTLAILSEIRSLKDTINNTSSSSSGTGVGRGNQKLLLSLNVVTDPKIYHTGEEISVFGMNVRVGDKISVAGSTPMLITGTCIYAGDLIFLVNYSGINFGLHPELLKNFQYVIEK